jgi:ribosomal-protein-alanine N-acetyltransferase
MSIETDRIGLQPQTPAELLALYDVGGPNHSPDVSPDWLAMVRALVDANPGDSQWSLGFAVVDRHTAVRVGNAGFKGPPDAEGMVEIAYATEPEFQGRGYATEAAAALVALALDDARVRLTRAHTLPEPNASTRVLTKCGFTFVGEVIDPEDGRVWRWERPRPTER